MTPSRKQTLIVALIIPIILIADQVLKIWIKTHLQIGEEIPLIGSWCKLHFVENVGMAFGMAFGGSVGKLLLTLFRFVASIAVMWAIVHYIRKGAQTIFIVSLALIFVGAIGNLIDCCFYGLIFNESYYNVAQLFPPEGGYAPFLYGRVVDMFYFPLFRFDWPEWVPFVGGEEFEFFNAIFNIADSAITVGIAILIIFYLQQEHKKKKASKTEENPQETAD
ncbi:MAG: lipoprotein signal peptidase [Bacteroidales bacterium]|nr:lipoprotein signal peptidase [Bacteroidales bacterium]